MYSIHRRALYNLLRMNWLSDPSIPCEQWQIADYRSFDLTSLFKGLKNLGVELDQESFLIYAEEVESPEELTDLLFETLHANPEQQDRAYLLLFEIWRRLLPEKVSLSFFCDELDHQIFLYDQDGSNEEAIQDIIANLQTILDDNVDEGGSPSEVFASLCAASANDLESFLYDYIAEQIDTGNNTYAHELVEGFSNYLGKSKWFHLLKIHLQQKSDNKGAQEELKKIVQKAVKEEDLEFNLELLSFISQYGEKEEFTKLVKKTASLLKNENDFHELLNLCGDYFRFLDEDLKEQAILTILNHRSYLPPEQPIQENDPHLTELLKVIK